MKLDELSFVTLVSWPRFSFCTFMRVQATKSERCMRCDTCILRKSSYVIGFERTVAYPGLCSGTCTDFFCVTNDLLYWSNAGLCDPLT